MQSPKQNQNWILSLKKMLYPEKEQMETGHQGGFWSIKIPTYKSIPLKGIWNWVENKNYGMENANEKRQSAELRR